MDAPFLACVDSAGSSSIAPFADLGGDLVMAEPGADCESHGLWAEIGAIVATRPTLAYPVAQKYRSDASERILRGLNG